MRLIAGWKTKFGNLIVFIGGSLYITSEWYFIPDRIIIGTIIIGAAIAFNGFYNRFCRAFYMTNEKGNPDMKRSKLKKVKAREGVL
jgi:hypothetical protein